MKGRRRTYLLELFHDVGWLSRISWMGKGVDTWFKKGGNLVEGGHVSARLGNLGSIVALDLKPRV